MVDYTLRTDSLNLPINKEICFSNHENQFKEKIMKDQAKILKTFSSFLKPLLEPGEEIWLGVEATAPMSFLEQWTTGWVIYYLKRCVLIFTNKRILHFPTKHDFMPKHSVSQIRYGDIEEFKLSGFLGRVLKIEYKSGKKEKFYYVKSREFKKLRTLEQRFIKNQPSNVGERHFLCPRCVTPLVKDIFSCPNCHLEFKNMKDAIKLSLLFPGGGYLYTRHPVVGIMDALTEGFLLILLLANVVGALRNIELWGSVLFAAFLLFIEKLITIYHAKHYVGEYIPADKTIGVVSQNPGAEPFPYQKSSNKGKTNWPKLVFAILFLIFGLSFLGRELYLYAIAPRIRNSAQSTRREVPLSPEHQRALAALIESKYTRMDDYEKWIPVLYQQKDFQAVESRLIDLSKDRSNEAQAYQLYMLYRTLGDVNNNKDIHLKQGILDEWCSQQPDSHIPWLLRGIFYTGYAWQIRGWGWAKDVPKDAWPKFEAMLHRARADLEKSYRLNPKDPNSSCHLLIVAKGLSLSRDEMEKYFQNAISVSPFHYGSHYQKLNYLMPKWHGTQEEMNDFAMECLKSSDEHPYLGLVNVAALEESHYRSPGNKNYLGRDDVWPTVEKIYENYFTKYPEDIRRRFFYAYSACLARKHEAAIKQFEIIGDCWTEGTSWDSLNDYHRSRAGAYAAYAMRLAPEQAMVVLKKSIDLDPFQRGSYFKLGTTAAKLGRYDEAEAAYLKVLEIDPTCAEAHLLLCQIYEKTNNPARAKYHGEKALQCNPTEQQKRTAKNYIDVSNKGMK